MTPIPFVRAPLAWSGSRPVLPGLLLLLLSAVLGPTGRADQGTGPNELDVGVRSYVDKPLGFKRTEAPPHGKVYAIVAVQEYKAEEKLVRPVNEREMMRILREEMNRHGYREIVKGEAPEIVLGVEYGRGYLPNPYLADASADAGGGGLGDSGDGLVLKIRGAMPLQLLKQKEAGYNGKMQKAEFEKLYIKVTAFQYPSPSPHQPKKVWKTIMLVDDPDHRDLNHVLKEMLAAGVTFFDHATKDPEVDVYRPLPDGHVKVGPVEVVEPAKSKTP